MNKIQFVAQFMEAVEKANWTEALSHLNDEFKFYGPEPDPVDKDTWLAFQQALKTALPDWSFNLTEIEDTGPEVILKIKISGTHTGPLDLPVGSLPKLPATQLKVKLPEETIRIVFHNDKIGEIHTASILQGGIMGLLQEMGMR